MELSTQELLKWFTKFRRTVYFRIVYLVVLGVIVAELFPIIFGNAATACLGLLLMPAAVFVVPYYFGERKTKNLALNGIPVFIIAMLLVSAFQTQASTDPTPFVLTDGNSPTTNNTSLPPLSLWEGTVTPFKATPPADFTFKVRLKTNGVNMTNVTVYLNLTTVQGFSGYPSNFTMQPSQNTTNGTWFSVITRLNPGIYEFGFSARDNRGNFTRTVTPLGPITGGFFDYYILWAYLSALYLAIPFSFYYVIVFMFWYTARMRKMRARMIDVGVKGKGAKKDEEEAKPKPTPGGKAAKVTAFTCTNCGADVEETDDKCPKCGAVFED